jgi:hypothetical protein
MNVRFCALRMLWCELERGQGAAGREPNGTSQWKTVNAPTQATEETENNQPTNNNNDPPTDYTETNTHIHTSGTPSVFLGYVSWFSWSVFGGIFRVSVLLGVRLPLGISALRLVRGGSESNEGHSLRHGKSFGSTGWILSQGKDATQCTAKKQYSFLF